MTNTKFRKRALLSSVAMLLVALVALGSATFAWFTSNPNANALGLNMKATAAKGLVIITGSSLALSSVDKSDDSDWLHTDYFNVKSDRSGTKVVGTDTGALLNVDAASLNQTAGTFVTTVADEDFEYDADPDAAVTAVTPSMATGGVYSEEVWCKITGDTSTATSIQMDGLTIDDSDNATEVVNAFRVAVYYTNASGTKSFIGEYALAAANNENHVTGTAATYSAAAHSNANILAAGSGLDAALGTCDNTGNCKLDLYFYLDGEDDDCFTNNVDINQIIDGVEVALSIA